ncbi:MAG: UDP-N-acetylglucosamine 1-carboxyvinyltransferase [Patescibacteria group bacterium]
MDEHFIIRGGKPLNGSIEIRGSKNAALPFIAACLLTDEPCTLENVPAISDVKTMQDIAAGLGADISWNASKHHLTIAAKHLTGYAPDETLSRKLRGSILFAGALLGRLRKTALPYPGGDAIGARPVGAHLAAFEALGVKISEERVIELDGRELKGNNVLMAEPSVTATENIILAAVLAPGRTVISLGALEPHVQELILFLQKMGADIRWSHIARIEIAGVPRLHGATHRINPDELEISGFAALAGATRSEMAIRGIRRDYLDAVLLQLAKMGVQFTLADDEMRIHKPSAGYKGFRIQSGLYPKLGSDHLPPFAVLATQAEGTSLIHDWMYEHRLRYLQELQKMGANCEILDPHRARITGPTVLFGCPIDSLDIRSGMTLVIAALVADGESTIAHINHIDRGYENIDGRLRALGADIERVKSNE